MHNLIRILAGHVCVMNTPFSKTVLKLKKKNYDIFLAHLSRRLIGELIGYSWSGVCPSLSVVHNAQYKLALATCSDIQNFRIVMQRFVSNWLCSITMEKKRIFFFFLIPPTFTSDMSGKKISRQIEFYFYFFFVLRLSHLAEKICKTKNKKTLA